MLLYFLLHYKNFGGATLDNISLALNMIFTGVSVVFLCLMLLVFVIYVMPKALSLFTKKIFKKIHEPQIKNSSSNISNELQIIKTSLLQENEHADELIAVITSAVLACFNPEVHSRIKIKQIKRVSDKPPVWNNVSRNEQNSARHSCY